MMNQGNQFDFERQANIHVQRKISDKLPKMHFVADNIVKTHDNFYFGAIQIEGVYVDLESKSTINAYDDLLHNVISSLDENFGIYGHIFRRKVETEFYIAGESTFTREFNKKYRDKFRNAPLYKNELILTLVYRKQAEFLQRTKAKFKAKSKAQIEKDVNIAIAALNGKLSEITTQLGRNNGFRARIIDDPNESAHKNKSFSEMLSFLGGFVNGLEKHKYAYPNEPLLAHASPTKAKEYVKYPYGNLGEFLAADEIRFIDRRYFICPGSPKKLIGAMITIKNYALGTTPVSFDLLSNVSASFLLTVSFFPLARMDAVGKTERISNKYQQTHDKARSQLAQLETLQDALSSEIVTMGQSHNSVMLLSETKESLDDECNEVIKAYGEAGFRAVVETFNTNAAFWAQFPCNRKYINRARPVTSDVICHFFPLHNCPTGHNHKTHLGEALCLVETPGQAPMWFNWHKRGSGQKSDVMVGHSLVVGATGFGKTVLLLALNSLAEKYGSHSFLFDYEHGMYLYALATGSPYMSYDVDKANEVQHNPFLMVNNPASRKFCIDWLCDMVSMPEERDEEKELEIDPFVKEKIVDCVNHAFDRIPPEQRTLSNVCDLYLGHDFPRWPLLKPFLRANPRKNRADGIYCEFFDNDKDIFNARPKKVFFETSKLKKDPRLKTLLLKYIFYKIKLSRSDHNNPICITLDEMWFNLDDPSWAKWFKSELVTLRKKDIHIIGATQSAESIIESPASTQFMNSTATLLFAPNATAKRETYEAFGITPTELKFLKETPLNQRVFLFKQGSDSAICGLHLADFDRELAIFSANQASVKIADDVLASAGNDPELLLPALYQRLGF